MAKTKITARSCGPFPVFWMGRLAADLRDELAAHGLGIALAENRGAHDEHVRARFLAGEDVVELHAAVEMLKTATNRAASALEKLER